MSNPICSYLGDISFRGGFREDNPTSRSKSTDSTNLGSGSAWGGLTIVAAVWTLYLEEDEASSMPRGEMQMDTVPNKTRRDLFAYMLTGCGVFKNLGRLTPHTILRTTHRRNITSAMVVRRTWAETLRRPAPNPRGPT